MGSTFGGEGESPCIPYLRIVFYLFIILRIPGSYLLLFFLIFFFMGLSSPSFGLCVINVFSHLFLPS